jgi:hypothetical protein
MVVARCGIATEAIADRIAVAIGSPSVDDESEMVSRGVFVACLLDDLTGVPIFRSPPRCETRQGLGIAEMLSSSFESQKLRKEPQRNQLSFALTYDVRKAMAESALASGNQ